MLKRKIIKLSSMLPNPILKFHVTKPILSTFTITLITNPSQVLGHNLIQGGNRPGREVEGKWVPKEGRQWVHYFSNHHKTTMKCPSNHIVNNGATHHRHTYSTYAGLPRSVRKHGSYVPPTYVQYVRTHVICRTDMTVHNSSLCALPNDIDNYLTVANDDTVRTL